MVDDPARRRAIAEVFEACDAEALSYYPRSLGDRYANLKLAGIKEAPAQLTASRIVKNGASSGASNTARRCTIRSDMLASFRIPQMSGGDVPLEHIRCPSSLFCK
jgi:hypothetical protein